MMDVILGIIGLDEYFSQSEADELNNEADTSSSHSATKSTEELYSFQPSQKSIENKKLIDVDPLRFELSVKPTGVYLTDHDELSSKSNADYIEPVAKLSSESQEFEKSASLELSDQSGDQS